jgi:tetratricopeptide (TPR) repeat protein
MIDMKNLFIAALATLTFYFSHAQDLETPQPSPTAYVKQNFGLSTIELSYSRPGVKGRNIFGDLVPFGKVWRTGANSATTITFGDDVNIGGKKVKAGKYGLLTIPEASYWTIIISNQTDVTSPSAYKEDQDVVRVKADVNTLPFSVETFAISVDNIKSDNCIIGFLWDNVYVGLPVSTDIDKKVMAQIDDVMKKDNKPYFSAAMYYMDNNKDLNQALAWFDKAAEMQPQAFWVQHQRANCLAKLGKKEEAKKAAEKSKMMAAAAKNDDYVKLNEKLLAELNK